MIIRGIHYGLTLVYSYLLPFLDVEESSSGFRFKFQDKLTGSFECLFHEEKLETTCEIKYTNAPGIITRMLGIEKVNLFKELCSFTGSRRCITGHITLMYEPSLKRSIAYTIYLSRNTNYYTSTIRWIKEFLVKGFIRSSSYIPREFFKNKDRIDNVFTGEYSPVDEAIKLLKIKGIGVKSVKAFLLHAYGLTEHAPIDIHYSKFLDLRKHTYIKKDHCIYIALDCSKCKRNCVYHETMRRFGIYNGIIQSLSYIVAKLKSHMKPGVLEVLTRNPHYHAEEFEKELYEITDRFDLSR